MAENRPNDESQKPAKLIEKLLSELARLPGPLQKGMKGELEELLKLLENKRSPRFMFVGRRGAGKTSLINAIFGAEVGAVGHVRSQTGATSWKTYTDTSGKQMDVLDTRGVQEGSRPQEEDDAATSEESVFAAIENLCPDVFLFLVKAKEVDAAIERDLDALEKFLQKTQDYHGVTPSVIGLVTQCDELDPPGIWLREKVDEPELWQEKMAYIEEATEILHTQLKSRTLINENMAYVLPVVAYVRFKPDGTILPMLDRRWNIDELIGILLDSLPIEAQLDFARLAKVRHHQRTVAHRVVEAASGVCALIGMEPIPIADLPILTSIQIMMVMMIAYISGREFSWLTAKEFLGATGVHSGSAYVLREGARALIKLFPGLGNTISGGVAAAGTLFIGNTAIFYFIDNSDIEEAKRLAELEVKSS